MHAPSRHGAEQTAWRTVASNNDTNYMVQIHTERDALEVKEQKIEEKKIDVYVHVEAAQPYTCTHTHAILHVNICMHTCIIQEIYKERENRYEGFSNFGKMGAGGKWGKEGGTITQTLQRKRGYKQHTYIHLCISTC
jgi:hypothetical protein